MTASGGGGLRAALGLLTRVPVGGGDPSRAPAWFAVVGAGVGVVAGAVYAGLHAVTAARVAAYAAVGAGVALTGALHEDGLADTADAGGAHVPRERRMQILKDPRVGTFGAIALVLSVVLRAESLSVLRPATALAALVAAHAIGRAAAACAIAAMRPASANGLGATFGGGGRRLRDAAVNVVCAAVFAAMLGPAGAVALAAGVVGAAACGLVAHRAFGGQTGDVLGAVEQCAEIAALAAAAAAA